AADRQQSPTKPASYRAPSHPDPAPSHPAAADSHPNSAPSKRVSAPDPVRGTVSASFGALAVPDMAIEIHDRDRDHVVDSATPKTDGIANASLTPGHYCAAAVEVPDGVVAPDPVTFTAHAGKTFTVEWDSLAATAATTAGPDVSSAFVMRPL